MRCAAAPGSLARSGFISAGQGCGRAAVSVFADQRINSAVLAELFHAGRENDEIGTIGKRHASSVDSLVSQPSAAVLVRVQKDDRLVNRAVERLDVNRPA